MQAKKDSAINYVNIVLMLVSCAAAFIMPFELFLLSYAILGPLHYLTEISWLHDRQYFVKQQHDYKIGLAVGILILLQLIARHYGWRLPFSSNFYNKIIFIAFAGALLIVLVSNTVVKAVGLFLIIVIAELVFKMDNRDGLLFFTIALLPTLIHVYLFTGFFILYGALKSRTASGLLSLLVFIICPCLLFGLFRDTAFFPISNYGQRTFLAKGDGFFNINLSVLRQVFGVQFQNLKDVAGNVLSNSATGKPMLDRRYAADIIFHSKTSILLMRFIAFAYTYHYLNWFSKTEIIRWHKVPATRFVVVILVWIFSLFLYALDYGTGLKWLFFLSLCHVLLEFPLNIVSIKGIVKESQLILTKGFNRPLSAEDVH